MQQQFKFQPSRYFAVMLVAAHGAALVTLLPLALPAWTKWALATLILYSLIYYWRRDAWLSTPSSSDMVLMLNGDQAVLGTRCREQLAGQVLRCSLATPFVIVLNILPQGERFARGIIILPDSLDAESFRQLRVWLRWECNNKKPVPPCR